MNVEISYTNFETGEPAISHIRAAIGNQKHVITSNKGPIALKYRELTELAHTKKVNIGVEGTVMSGTPALNLGTKLLSGTEIHRIEGILNGTTNFILTKMGNGMGYAAALAEAQERGYAEADPTGDVEGFDTAGKLVILSTTIMSTPLDIKQIDRVGITNITENEISKSANWMQMETYRYFGKASTRNSRKCNTCLPAPKPSARECRWGYKRDHF
jgi:homoserine dehydrogenase